jgi:hypothetical protein
VGESAAVVNGYLGRGVRISRDAGVGRRVQPADRLVEMSIVPYGARTMNSRCRRPDPRRTVAGRPTAAVSTHSALDRTLLSTAAPHPCT